MGIKLYTKKGDNGTTSLLSGTRVPKTDNRIKAVGVLDELNSFIGLMVSKFDDESMFEELQWVLFNAGSMVINDNNMELTEVTETDITKLEQNIDSLDALLPPLKNFILPRGDEKVTLMHVCRTIARRAEVACIEAETNPIIIKYLNRLSDYFFILARYYLMDGKMTEIIWKNQ